MKDRHKEGYFKNYSKKPEVKEKLKKYKRERQKKFILFIEEFKKSKCCSECGWKGHSEILQFHHKNPQDKHRGISHMVLFSYERIMKEIKKCDLLCPNCHLWIHHKNSNF